MIMSRPLGKRKKTSQIKSDPNVAGFVLGDLQKLPRKQWHNMKLRGKCGSVKEDEEHQREILHLCLHKRRHSSSLFVEE